MQYFFVFINVVASLNVILASKTRVKRQLQPSSGSGSQRVGFTCRFNTDCISGAFCSSSVCQCWSTYVNVNSYCWPKINPDQSGCTYLEQCSAVWPGATCESSVCRCPFNRPPQQTRDGPVCYIPGNCPTNNQWPKLREPGTTELSKCEILPLANARNQLGCSIYDDIYDCIDYQTSRGGYCCPSRSLTCIMPVNSGFSTSGSSPETRFFFNSISQSCQQFRYLGAGGNSNNFLSEIQCQSYCNQACKRGHPEYTPENPTSNIDTQIRYCSSSSASNSGCGGNYQCDRSGSTQLCCPKVSFICSSYGGLLPLSPSTPPLPPYSSGITPAGATKLVRWYYDETQKRCLTFSFGGEGGNYNNFLSRDDCEAYCAAAVCDVGEPLKDSSGINAQACTGNSQCPSTHECKNTVCCPTKYTICNQPKVTGGSCNNYATRYWFNTQTGSCEQFLYTGCRGNANNFETYLDCQDFCSSVTGEPKCAQGTALKDRNLQFITCSGAGSTNCPSNYECQFDGRVYGCCATRTYTCSLGTSVGTTCGPSSSTRWYFDTTTKTCKTFVFLGCDGNSNNFATQIDCVDYCRAGGCPDFGEPLKDLGGQVQLCGTRTSFSCPATHTCTAVNADNLGSNVANVIILPGSVVNYCCPKKSTVCAFGADNGANCGSALTRYYFSTRTRACEQFTYYGCGGNSNNFPDRTSCENYCSSSACNPGEEIYKEPGINTIRYCNPSVLGSCPIGFNCIFDQLNQRSVCCGATNLGVCPSNSKAYIDGFTGEARQCTANVVGSCPNDFICYFNPTKRLFYCCSRTTPAINPSAVCGVNRSPYIVGGAAVTCAQAAAPGGCPLGYQCLQGVQSTVSNTVQYYCCQDNGAIVNPVQGQECPLGYQLYTQPSGLPQYCNPYQADSCPVQGICQLIQTTRKYQCCTKTGFLPTNPIVNPFNTDGLTCSTGQPYVNPLTGSLTLCSPGSICPIPGYQCQQAPNNPSTFICCPTMNGYAAYCSNNQEPFKTLGKPLTCSLFTISCPRGYQCFQNSLSSPAYCCPAELSNSVTVCPFNRRPYMIIGTQPQTCSPFFSQSCPNGYNCESSSQNNSLYYCCSQSMRFFSQENQNVTEYGS